MADTKHNLAFIIGSLILIILGLNTAFSAYNFEYTNTSTRVNITNAMPEIDSIKIDQNILLNAGLTKIVNCNVSLHDWNGYSDIMNVNATFWDANNALINDSDNNNTHYTNTNCVNISQNGYYANYTCSFAVYYYANNGSNWTCNATVIDGYNFTATGKNVTSIQPIYALNTTPIIDFGNMAVGDTKDNITANVTNFGNRPINISVDGYGVVPNDGLAMKCAIRNISLASLHYSINETDWTTTAAVTSSPVNISGLTIPKKITTDAINTTYWHLYISPSENPFGLCNGTVVFTAQMS